jgi:thymidylate kinase
MLITFSGLDGAGKSTLIGALQETLRSRRHSTVVFHMNDHVGLYASIRLIRDRLFGGPPKFNRSPAVVRASEEADRVRRLPPITRAYRAVRNAVVWNRTLRRLLYPLDLLVFLCHRLYHERVRHRVMIMDRYFYDTLIDLADGHSAWGRLLERVTPTPDVAVLLEVPPERAFARKQEWSVELLARRWRAYQQLFPRVSSSVVIANQDLGSAKAALEKVVLARLRTP